jgi:phosphatidylglycerol:prolipoprotein diacylglycerol transferase
MPDAFWVHNIDPIFLKIGSFQIRYYGLFFAAAMIQGGYFWTRQIVRSGRTVSDALPLIWIGIFGVLIGGRIVHVLFYTFEQFLDNPLILIALGRGGYASHGSTLGLLTALFIYSRLYKMPYVEALDRCTLSIPLATSLVRMGNFFNSEIVGRPADVPWAVIFSRYDWMVGMPPTPRHPSQLYEVAIGIVVFVILYLTDRKLGEARPRGLMAGLILTSYFTLRFFVEFFKTYQALDPSFPLTMGQILSIPFAAAGLALIIRAFRNSTC